MVNRSLTLNVDDELILKAKENKLNLSRFMRDKLNELFGSSRDNTSSELSIALSELKREIKSAKDWEIKLEKRIEEINNQKKSKMEKLKDIPEINNLTKEQLNNTQLLMDIVGVVRTKYDLRIGTADVIEFYRWLEDGNVAEES